MKKSLIPAQRSFLKFIATGLLFQAMGFGPWPGGLNFLETECLAAASANAAATSPNLADTLISQWGARPGICVLLGDPTGQLAVKLARESKLVVYAQLPEARNVEAVRKAADAAGLYGTRIFVDKGPLTRIHLADNLADLLLAVGEVENLSEAEALRVIQPQATAQLGGKVVKKPVPPGLDDWSHPYHGPDNNPLSHDRVIRAPYLTQFLADPRYAPLPQLAVASGGRIFKAFGHIAFKAREEPWLNTLAAFNGYNGALLWRREIAPALMVHRNILIATPTQLFFGDDKSCKIINAATGQIEDEITPPVELTGGTFWKWMALENGVLYALVGEQEQRDPVIKARMENHGWPWNPLSPGFNQPEHTWGFGRTLLALDPATKKILWRYQEQEPIDSRALSLGHGRLYAFRFGAFLTCLDAKTGQPIWRKTPANAADLFTALGSYLPRQDWRTNWRTTAYLKGSDQALYFAGPAIDRLIAVSTQTGQVLWQHPYNNYQLVLTEDGLYGISGQIDKEVSRKFDPLNGKILEEIKLGRRACTRPTGCLDAIFFRAGEGSTRLDMASNHPELISPMRAQCQDGVTIANGLLYWWPSVCDCNLTLYGITSLGPAGNFDFNQTALESERLETESANAGVPLAALPQTTADWPAFRANNTGAVTTEVELANTAQRLWQYSLSTNVTPTAPTLVGGLVFIAGSDGEVRALNESDGKLVWKAFTGGAIRFPPTIAENRAFVGSGDGWVYAFEAKTGRQLWRFRAAPTERWIPVYGELASTWPAASGVLVDHGVAYVAAGIVNYDGTHVYALDAATGRIKWQNNASGHLDAEAHTGVSVQGHLMVYDGKLWMPGGNAVSPAVYDLASGRCLNDAGQLRRLQQNNVPATTSPRGWELYQFGNGVMVSGKPFYSHPKYPVFDASVLNKTLFVSNQDCSLAWVNNAKVMCFEPIQPEQKGRLQGSWGKPQIPGLKTIWENQCKDSVALALAKNAVVIAQPTRITLLNLADGKILWSRVLPSAPVPWGLAISRHGRLLVTLDNGQVLCLGPGQELASR